MIKRELLIFIIVGSITVLIDYLVYRSLIWVDFAGVDSAKATGFIVGTVFAYFANRFWTFAQKSHAPGSPWRFVLLYAVTLGANVWINAISLSVLDGVAFAVHLAFLFATGISAALNFIGMKFFVFKVRTASENL